VSFGDVTVGGHRLFTAIIRDVAEANASAKPARQRAQLHKSVYRAGPGAYIDRSSARFHNKATGKPLA
jgi:hypothetical protein